MLAAARREPTLFIVEDVHWADRATLDLLKYLARRIARAPLVLVLSYRDDEVGPDHPLITLLGEAGAAMRRIVLAPLSRAAVDHLAAGREGVYELTGGNPFYVTEVLAADAEGIPPTVRDAVLARTAKLTPEARRVIEIASLMPGRAELPLIDAADGAIEAAARSGIARLHDGAMLFRHELARRAVESSLSDLRRIPMHRVILARLIDLGECSLARLAHHAAGARDATAILRFSPLAAAEAARVGAHREAGAHYHTALQYAGGLGEADRAAVLESLAYEFYLTEQHHEALEHRVEATAIRRRLGDQRREGDNLRWQSRLNWFLGRNTEARQRAAEAIGILENVVPASARPLGISDRPHAGAPPSAELAMAYSNQAQLHMLAQECDAAMAWGERAIEIASDLGDDEILAHALNNVGTAQVLAGDESGFQMLEESLRLSLQRGFQEHAARAYTNIGSESVRRGDYVRAQRYLEEGLAYCRERDLDSWLIYMSAWQARLHLERGAWDAAAASAQAVLAHPGTSPISRIPALVVLGTVRTRRGDPGATALLDEARDLAQRTAELQRIAPVAIARAEAAWLHGDTAAADEVRGAYVLSERLGETIERRALAMWMWRTGAIDARPDVDALGSYEEALALGDSDDVGALKRAVGILEHLGDGCLIHVVKQKLRARGVRGPRQSTRANPAGLTAREIEILHLLDEGLRNAEIAERLHVSPKTVDHHVSSVLAKLGVKTRGEASRAARERQIIG